MAILAHSFFQLPIPSILYLIPPSSSIQWLFRGIFVIYTILLVFPLLLILIPLSVILPPKFAPLPIHPDNLPPIRSYHGAIFRGLLVYTISTLLWSITGIGNAPERSIEQAREKARKTVEQNNKIYRKRSSKLADTDNEVYGDIILEEDMYKPLKEDLRMGVMALEGIPREDMLGFWIKPPPLNPLKSKNNSLLPEGKPFGKEELISSTTTTTKNFPRKIYLFLAGGGYVTGKPLEHPFICSLVRTFPHDSRPGRIQSGSETTLVAQTQPDHAVYAPRIHKALSVDRSFPTPVLDAVAAYAHIREQGYLAKEITVIGDSAGGGLAWSTVAYLTVLRDAEKGDLGVPGGFILMSPWVSLPPTEPLSTYPDTIDSPMLLNAARCYLARFPLLKNRPDPFASDWILWQASIQNCFRWVSRRASAPPETPRNNPEQGVVEEDDRLGNLHNDVSRTLVEWLQEDLFHSLSSHHPFVSPSTTSTSTFVTMVGKVLEQENTDILIHCGTAEWFYQPTMRLAEQLIIAGAKVTLREEIGGYHMEDCETPGEWGGAAGRVVERIVTWDNDRKIVQIAKSPKQ